MSIDLVVIDESAPALAMMQRGPEPDLEVGSVEQFDNDV
jgi:hypothetical protein